MLRKLILWIPFGYLVALLVLLLILAAGVFDFIKDKGPIYFYETQQPLANLLYSVLIIAYLAAGLLLNIILRRKADNLSFTGFALYYGIWLLFFVMPSVCLLVKQLAFPVFEK